MDILIDSPRRRKPLTTYYLPVAIKDQIMLNSMLLTGAQCDPRYSQQALYYRGKLMQSITQALNDKAQATSDSVVAGLVKLETDEVCFGL